jgi:hypothetical protein
LLLELRECIWAENLPAIARTQEQLAEAVERLSEAKEGPRYPEPQERDFDLEDGL